MSNANQGPLSGFRDMLAETMIPRQKMLDTIRDVYESYGFTPLKTPAIERLETLVGKYGEEGDKLMYKFKDNGDRDVALRYDLTVPLARVVGKYGSQILSPWYKRYAVAEVWRGDSPQAGRYREFAQFDADIVGSASPVADAELIDMIIATMAALNAPAIVRVNNRRILDALVEKAQVESGLPARRFVGTIDKIDKIGIEAVCKDIREANGNDAAELVQKYLSIKGSSEERIEAVRTLLGDSEAAKEGLDNLAQIFAILKEAGRTEQQVVFDPTIARGLDYYTGVICETNLLGAPELGSVCSGGRYDNLVEALGGPAAPANGISIGVDRLFDGLQRLGVLQSAKTPTQVMITNFTMDDAPAYYRIANELRAAGIATEVFYEDARIGKQLTAASKQNIPYVVLIGPAEMKDKTAKLRTMGDGTETEVPLKDLITALQKHLAA